MSVELEGLSTAHIYAFLLIMVRMGGIMMLAPLFAGRSIPNRIKLVFAAGLTLVTLPLAMTDPTALAALGVGELLVLMIKEAVMGLIVGFAAGAIVVAWQMAAALLDVTIGFSYGGIVDPLTGNQTPVLQQLYGLLAAMIFITIGGDHLLIGALVGSYELVPLTGFVPTSDIASLIVNTVVDVFRVGVGVAAPVLVALLLTDIAFGLVARAAPQAQIMGLEFPVKIAVGIVLIMATLPFMAAVFETGMKQLFGPILGAG